MGKVTLFHYWSSVCSQKVRFALEEKRIEWTSQHVDLFRFENWARDYLELNPRGVVPTLVCGTDVITESNVILEYLEDVFSERSLRPAASGHRARMRAWLRTVDERVHPSIVEVSFNSRHRPRWKRLCEEELQVVAGRHPDPDYRSDWLRRVRSGVSRKEEAWHYERLERVCEEMETTLAVDQWLAGPTFSLADVALAPYLVRLQALGREESVAAEQRPNLAAWRRRLEERPAFKTAFAFEDPATASQPGGA